LFELSRINGEGDNPIVDWAHALAVPALTFEQFERMIRRRAKKDDRVSGPAGSRLDLMGVRLCCLAQCDAHPA